MALVDDILLGTMNPEPEARAAELLARRLDAAVAPVQQALRFVTDRALDEIKDRHDKQLAARAALEVAQADAVEAGVRACRAGHAREGRV